MVGDYEGCRRNLEGLVAWYAQQSKTRNEATTRLHLIDTLIFECLAWRREEVRAEEHNRAGFADYTFRCPRRILILEAKKEGDYFQLPSGWTNIEYPLSRLMRDYANVKAAIEQVTRYCHASGVPYAAISNGHQLVVFAATRTDGLSPFDGKALVFGSLDSMLDNFMDLWQALSRPGIEDRNLVSRLLGDMSPQAPPKLSASIFGYPGVKNRNILQTDLQIVAELVMEDMSRSPSLEGKFLEECYCPSGALSQHSLVSKAILKARYAALFDGQAPGPVTVPAVTKKGVKPTLIAESTGRRPVLLIGDVGVGKTTFIRHLIKVDATDVLANSVSLYLDLGSSATLSADLKSFVPSEIGRQLEEDHCIDIDERNFIRGAYRRELDRFSRGIHSDLAETNPQLFREREIAYLERITSDRHEHVLHSLEHISEERRKQIVVFLDNADQRSEKTQQEAFLIAQEMAEHWPAIVFVALRPETFHNSRREGALSGYHPKAFTISPPRIDDVLRKRLTFGIRLATRKILSDAFGETRYGTLGKLATLMRVFLRSLRLNPELTEAIDNIAAGNVRVALDLVKGFFGSGHVDTKKILEIETSDQGSEYVIPLHEFLRAVIFGDGEYFAPMRSPVENLFDVFHGTSREHFLLPLLLAFLGASAGHQVRDGFVEADILYERLQGLGFLPELIDRAVGRAHAARLVTTSGRRQPDGDHRGLETLRATSLGLYHVSRLVRRFAYIDAIVVDTPIVDPGVRSQIHDARDIHDRLDRARLLLKYLDAVWQEHFACTVVAFDWPSVSHDLLMDTERIHGDLRLSRQVHRGPS